MDYKPLVFLLLLVVIITSCRPAPDSVGVTHESILKVERGKLNNRNVPEDILTLTTESDESVQTAIQENLFGKFFCDRVAFYVIENPMNEIYAAKTESIILYYLDGELRQTRYCLAHDITANLIKSLGSFKIQGYDFKNRKIIEAGQLITKTDHGWILNNHLDNYELKWTLGEREVKYRVNLLKKEGKFIYLEKVRDYEKEFKQLEKYCV
jgi:hypothetical protein